MELALRRVYLVESFAHEGQRALHLTRLRMRGAEDPPSPLDYVMQDSLGFEQVVACVDIKNGSSPPRCIQTQVIAGALGIAAEDVAEIPSDHERSIVIVSQRSSSRGQQLVAEKRLRLVPEHLLFQRGDEIVTA